jgi:UDP-N-acetylglucosamine 2-epimerase
MAQDRSNRRKNFGEGFTSISAALKKIAYACKDVSIIYTVSLNPSVKRPKNPLLKGIKKLITYSSSWCGPVKTFMPYPYRFRRRAEKDALI